MATRKFKAEWAPTPLLSPEEAVQQPRTNRLGPPTVFSRAVAIFIWGMQWLVRDTVRWLLHPIGKKPDRSAGAASEARLFGERMGGMWIALAQLVSLRTDLLGQEFCKELAKTRDRAQPLSMNVVRKLVDDELHVMGTSFEQEFSEFDEQPLSARAFGQFHRARLKNSGQQVIVRIRAPDAVQRAATDLRIMRVLALIARHLNLEPNLRWDDLVFEVKQITDDLLDFRTEVTEHKKIRKALRRRRIYVPLILSRLCSEKILTFEYVQGVSVAAMMWLSQTDPERCEVWMKDNNISRSRIWRRIFNMHHELVLENNLFHTALAPQSIILLKDNKIALVNLSTIGTMDAGLHREYKQLYRAILDRDFTKASETYLAMLPALPYKDISDMRGSAVRALRIWESKTHVRQCPYEQKSLASAIGRLMSCASEYEFPSFWNLARLQMAENTLASSLSFIQPVQNNNKALRRYERDAQLRKIKTMVTGRISNRINNAMDVAQLNLQLMENFQQDGGYLRRRLMDFQGRLGRASQIIGRLLSMIARFALLGLMIQVFIYVKRLYDISIPTVERGTAGRILNILQIENRAIWILMMGILLYGIHFLWKVAKQLSSTEVRPSDVL